MMLHSATLLTNEPKRTIELLKIVPLPVSNIISSLICYDRKWQRDVLSSSPRHHFGLEFLQHCITQNEDTVLHRYLLSLYETLPCTHPQVEKSLSQYLEKNLDRVDISCALRLCERFLDNDNDGDETKRTLRVRLLVASNNLESAVSTSLCMNNVDLAKQCANRARDLPLRRKLWTLVAKHVLKTARHDKKSQSEIFRSLLELCEEKSSPLELENVMSLLGDICSADKTMRDMICELLRGDDKRRDEMRAGVRDLNDASKRIRDMTRDVRGVRARSARVLIISLMIVSPSCLSLMISTRKSTLSLASLIFFRTRTQTLEHRYARIQRRCDQRSRYQESSKPTS